MSGKLEAKVLNALSIKPAEKHTVFWSVVLAFIVGIAHSYLTAIPMSLFLIRFSSTNLPEVYLAVAGLTMLLGSGYTWLEYHFLLNRLVLGLFLFVGLVTLLIWGLLVGIGSLWIIAFLIIWAVGAYQLLDMGLWSLLNHIYNLQQGKRLYGFIGAWQSIGGILAGVLLPVLLFFVSTEQVILITGLCVLSCLVIMVKLLKTHRLSEATDTDTDEAVETSKISISKLRGNRYILKLICLLVLGVFVMEVVDMLFNSIAEEHFPDKVALAGFLGVFFGVSDALDMFISAFLFSWILKRYGLIVSLMVLPIIMIIIGLFLLVSNQIPAIIAFVFWFTLLLKTFEEALRAAVFDMSSLLLLQPLNPAMRSFVLSKNDTLIAPLASIFISLILMFLTHVYGIAVPWFVILLWVCGGLSLIIALTIKKDYLLMLSKAIVNRYIKSGNFIEINRDSLPLFKTLLKSQRSDMVVYALYSIEQIDKKELLIAIDQLLESKDKLVRLFILNKIKQYHLTNYFTALLRMLTTETNDEIKALIINILADLNYSRARMTIKEYLTDKSSVVFSAALIARYRYGSLKDKETSLTTIREMLLSQDIFLRCSTAHIIGEINDPVLNNYLIYLFSTPDSLVKNEVLLAVIKTSFVGLFPQLLMQLDLVKLRGDVLKKFMDLAPFLMPIIHENFSSYSKIIQLKLLHLMAEMQIPSALIFLENMVFSIHSSIQHVALQSLSHVNKSNTPEFHNRLYDKINEELRSLEQLNEFLANIPKVEVTSLLRQAIERKQTLTIERLLLCIAIFYHDEPMMKVKTGLLIGGTEDIGYSLELLEGILNQDHKQRILPVLNAIYLEDEALAVNLRLDSRAFLQIIKNYLYLKDQESLTILTCLSCLYIIKSIGTTDFEQELMLLKQTDVSVIQETLTWLDD